MFYSTGCSQSTDKSGEKDDYQLLKEYFHNQHKFDIKTYHKRILVITQENCPSCNKTFASFVLSNINDTSSIVLITSDGTALDLTPFKNAKGLVFFDSSPIIDSDVFSKTCIIKLHNNSIDTVINIEARQIEEQLSWLINDLSE